MAKLKIEALPDDKPVKVNIELPAQLHRDLVAYAEAIGSHSGRVVEDPIRLIVPMLTRFIGTDRAFLRTRRQAHRPEKKG